MSKRVTKTSTSTALTNWEQELAAHADQAASMEANAGGGQFFGLRSGILTWQDAPLAGNQMGVVIVDSILENVYYEGKYDPDEPQSPMCYAFGRDDATMRPHPEVVKAHNEQCGKSGLCAGCQHNEWGTSEVGRARPAVTHADSRCCRRVTSTQAASSS